MDVHAQDLERCSLHLAVITRYALPQQCWAADLRDLSAARPGQDLSERQSRTLRELNRQYAEVGQMLRPQIQA